MWARIALLLMLVGTNLHLSSRNRDAHLGSGRGTVLIGNILIQTEIFRMLARGAQPAGTSSNHKVASTRPGLQRLCSYATVTRIQSLGRIPPRRLNGMAESRLGNSWLGLANRSTLTTI